MGMPQHKVAVIGSGIAGMAVARSLAPDASVTLFEAERWFGGHAHTVDAVPDAFEPDVDRVGVAAEPAFGLEQRDARVRRQ